MSWFSSFFSRTSPEPFTNVAPYGKCNTSPDALAWIPDGVTTQSCVEHDGFDRCWYTYTPNSVADLSETNVKVPVVVHLHGAGGCASLPALGWGNLAQENGFVVVWPQGLSFRSPFIPEFIPDFLLDAVGTSEDPSWNDGTGLFGAEANGIDDMGFLQKIVAQVLTDSRLDSTRLYFSGHSNGATMAQRFALQTDSIVAGVMAIGGAGMPNDDLWEGSASIPEYKPTPIIFVSGTIDQVVPFSERRGPLSGAIPALEGWAATNGCSGDPTVIPTSTAAGDYKVYSYTDCSNGKNVMLVEVTGAGHHPFTKGEKPFLVSPTNTIEECPFRGIPFFYEPDCVLEDLDTTRMAWDFVNGFQLASN